LRGPAVGVSCAGSGEEFADAIHAYLRQCVESRNPRIGIVVGLLDKHGSRVVGYGKLDDENDRVVNGDTLFEIGSDTKTFTALLLQDMVRRGEMRLDDPVAKYLPASVTMPTRNGKDITLRHLATHTSGLPGLPDNLDPKRADNPYADYTVEKLYAFLSRYQLSRDPGATSEYSNFGMGLLGHVIALKAGASYESLVVERICRPLQMDSTSISLTPELKSRFATPHNQFGEPVPVWDLPTLLAENRAAEAERVYREDLRRQPNNGWSLFGLTRSLRLQGKTDEAQQVDARFQAVWKDADTPINSSCFCQPGK
jgi:serine-type D-Ala-D-Ala carboxypeptidase/endopeptidase